MLVVSEHSACDLKLFDSNFEKKFALCFGRFSYFWVVFSDFEHFLAFLTFFQHWCFLAASSLFERSVGDLKLFGTFLSGKFFLMVLSVCPLISSCGEFSTIFDRFSAFVLLVRIVVSEHSVGDLKQFGTIFYSSKFFLCFDHFNCFWAVLCALAQAVVMATVTSSFIIKNIPQEAFLITKRCWKTVKQHKYWKTVKNVENVQSRSKPLRI